MNNWEKKNIWRKRGDNFLVEIFHSTYKIPPEYNFEKLGDNKWNVYAYIYKGHPLFDKFVGDSHYQPATENIPFHGGCTFLKYEFDNGECCCIKVGCDYSHYGDDEYSHYDEEDLGSPFGVAIDAEELYVYLSLNELVAPLAIEQDKS